MKFPCAVILVVLAVAALSAVSEARPQRSRNAVGNGNKRGGGKSSNKQAALPEPPANCPSRKCRRRFERLQKALAKQRKEMAELGGPNVDVTQLRGKQARKAAKLAKRVQKAEKEFAARTEGPPAVAVAVAAAPAPAPAADQVAVVAAVEPAAPAPAPADPVVQQDPAPVAVAAVVEPAAAEPPTTTEPVDPVDPTPAP